MLPSMASATAHVPFEDVVRALQRKGISLNRLNGDVWVLMEGVRRIGGENAGIRKYLIDDVCRAAPTADDAARAITASLDTAAAEHHWPTPTPEPLKLSREAKRNPALAGALQGIAAKKGKPAAAEPDTQPPAA